VEVGRDDGGGAGGGPAGEDLEELAECDTDKSGTGAELQNAKFRTGVRICEAKVGWLADDGFGEEAGGAPGLGPEGAVVVVVERDICEVDLDGGGGVRGGEGEYAGEGAGGGGAGAESEEGGGLLDEGFVCGERGVVVMELGDAGCEPSEGVGALKGVCSEEVVSVVGWEWCGRTATGGADGWGVEDGEVVDGLVDRLGWMGGDGGDGREIASGRH
jgi:hypothetical protein